jgi:hypothetical protein
LVEGVDHPVPIEPGLGDGIVRIVPSRIGIPGEIQPVATPALAISGRSKELFDESRIGVGTIVRDEGLHPIDGGGEPGEVERRATDQGPPVGGSDGMEA